MKLRQAPEEQGTALLGQTLLFALTQASPGWYWAVTSNCYFLVLTKPFPLPMPQFPFSSSCFCPKSTFFS